MTAYSAYRFGFVVILASIGFSGQAHASDGCSVVGMFDSRAKALCEQMRRSKQAQPAVQETAPQIHSNNSQDDNSAPLTQPHAPSRGFHRYDIAKGNLSVDLPEEYPQGYGPLWKLNATAPQAIIMDRYNLLNRGPQGTETLFVRIIDDQGRGVLEFARRGAPACYADIVGLPQVIDGSPKRFRLTNFRYANNQGPQCQRKLGSTSPWQGALTLSADRDGNLQFSLSLELAMPSGQPWFAFTARDLPFANQMTPQMASAELAHKQQVAAENAERERQAAAEHAKEVARLNALPVAGPVYARQMASYVKEDALGWAVNRLDVGSVHNVRIYSGSAKSGSFILRAEYTYNGGQSGWVVAKYAGGSFNCIQFWDSMIGCRALRKPGEGQVTLASIIEAGMSDSGSGRNSGANGGGFDQSRWNKSVGLNEDGTLPGH